MPRWLWWTPLGLFVLFFAVQSFRAGWDVVRLSETDVINSFAARYVAERQADDAASLASPADCLAYPGRDAGIWIVVSCGPQPFDPARHYTFHVNRFGGLERAETPATRGAGPADPGRPQT